MIQRLKSPRIAGGLVALFGVAVAALLLVTLSSGPTDAAAPQPPSKQGFSGLVTATPESVQSTDGLSPRAKLFLAEREDPNGPVPEKETLSAIETVATPAGDVIVAQFGKGLCMWSESRGGGTCGSTEFVDDGQLSMLFPTCEKALIIGLLPDSASGVTLESDASAGSASKLAPVWVRSNVYVAETSNVEGTAKVTGTTAAGPFSASIPLGAIAEGANCG